MKLIQVSLNYYKAKLFVIHSNRKIEKKVTILMIGKIFQVKFFNSILLLITKEMFMRYKVVLWIEVILSNDMLNFATCYHLCSIYIIIIAHLK